MTGSGRSPDIARTVEAFELDLSGQVVLTEAANGPYLPSAVIPAVAGAAEVWAVARTTRYGTVDEIRSATLELAERHGVADRVSVIGDRAGFPAGRVRIVTNSGHLRPIDRGILSRLAPRAAVSLMYEAWEFRSADLDLAEAKRLGIPVGGLNEEHPAIDVYAEVGVVAVQLLLGFATPPYGRTLIVSDNKFGPRIERRLRHDGAETITVGSVSEMPERRFDLVVVAATPRGGFALDARAIGRLAETSPGAVVAQFWGDVDRGAPGSERLRFAPAEAPRAGHMGNWGRDVSSSTALRMLVGGFKVGEILVRALDGGADRLEALAKLAESGYGNLIGE